MSVKIFNMGILISNLELKVLKLTADGINSQDLAKILDLSHTESEKIKVGVLKKLNAKDPLVALQNLAKNGFRLAD